MTIHKDIRFAFTLEDQAFEAVGFLSDGEQSTLGTTALYRCGGEDTLSEKEWQIVKGRKNKLPPELEEYFLVTSVIVAVDGYRFRHCLRSELQGVTMRIWREKIADILVPWYQHMLVLRRRE